MTDYAVPTTAADALRKQADDIDYRIKGHQQKIKEHAAIIEALTVEWGDCLAAADRYEKWQPKPAPTAKAKSARLGGDERG